MNLPQTNIAAMMLVLLGGHLFTGGLVAAYTSRHEKSKALNFFLLSELLQPIAWVLIGVRTFAPGMLIVAIANTLLFTGAALEFIAFMLLRGSYTPNIRKAYLGMLAVCITAFSAAALLGLPEAVRIAISSFGLALLGALPVYLFISDKKASVLQKVIAAYYGVTIALLLLRAFAAVATDLDMSLLSDSVYNAWLFVMLYLHMIAGSMGFVLLDKEKMDAELLRAATVDGLTDSMNRQTFEKRAAEMISMFARRQEPISCMLLDIDDFKKVNDGYGHLMGDTVLRSVAATIKGQLRDYDLFGRYGGEEFAILLTGTDNRQAMGIAERIRTAVEALRVGADPGIACTVSISVSTKTPDRQTTMDDFYRLSDKALYLAKDKGKNFVASASAERAFSLG